MKTHLLGNVGKGPGQFHQGHAGFGFGRFLLAHGRMTTGASALFLLGRRIRTEGLLTKGDPAILLTLARRWSAAFFWMNFRMSVSLVGGGV